MSRGARKHVFRLSDQVRQPNRAKNSSEDDFGFSTDCTVYVAKTQVPISCMVTAQLICVFVSEIQKSRFSHDTVHKVLDQDRDFNQGVQGKPFLSSF